MWTIRPLQQDDLFPVAGRLQAEYPGDGMSAANLQRKIWEDPDYDPELNLGWWDGRRWRALLLGVVRDEQAWIKVMTVHPDREAARALLECFERRCEERGARAVHVSGSAPSYLLPGVDPTDTVTLRFYLDHGFARASEAYNMRSDLVELKLDTQEDEDRLADKGLRCARLEPGDEPALREFMLAHFSANWLAETRQGLRNDPVTVHVAWREERIVAFAAAEVTNPGWFGPMGTAPNERKRGLGRVLLLRGLRDLVELGYREAQIGWVGPLGFYARHCGARVSRVFWMLKKELMAKAEGQ